MEQGNNYRHELKYPISIVDYLSMRSRLKSVMKADSHVRDDGKYLIRSIYFDNGDDKVLREKLYGFEKREKFRIRYYNDDYSFIRLEKKIKNGNLGSKCSAPLTEEECRKLLAGDTGWMKDHSEELIKELYAKMKYQGLRPRVLVSYIREPYIYRAGNVRVSFDSSIRSTLFQKSFLEKGIPDVIATDTPQDMILEVKYDAFLPEIIQDLIQLKDVRLEAFSKYGVSRRFG